MGSNLINMIAFQEELSKVFYLRSEVLLLIESVLETWVRPKLLMKKHINTLLSECSMTRAMYDYGKRPAIIPTFWTLVCIQLLLVMADVFSER